MRRRTRSRLAATALVSAGAAAGAIAWSLWRRHVDAERQRRAPGSVPVQGLADGYGPLFRRVYSLDIAGPEVSPRRLMAHVMADLDAFTPGVIARFEKTCGTPGCLAIGDEFIVHLKSPWDGPVRVDAVTPTSFRLVTLDGHLEAGAIAFSAYAVSDADARTDDLEEDEKDGGTVRVAIVSCARSRDQGVHLVYHQIGLARAVQQAMWTTFLRRIAERARGTATDVRVRTYTADVDDPLTQADADVPAPVAGLLSDFAGRALNFEPSETSSPGWNHDDATRDLLPELPGPPTPGGTFERAKAFVSAYRHPDPRRLVGVYDPNVALGERTMLLRARFLGLGFRFGVKTTTPTEEVVPGGGDAHPDGRPGDMHRWSYGYRTLEGHFERGEITFELQKHAATGRVAFRIHSYSQRGHIANPFYAIGMRVFGRGLQRQFVHRAFARTARYVEESLVRDACLRGEAIAQRLLRP